MKDDNLVFPAAKYWYIVFNFRRGSRLPAPVFIEVGLCRCYKVFRTRTIFLQLLRTMDVEERATYLFSSLESFSHFVLDVSIKTIRVLS